MEELECPIDNGCTITIERADSSKIRYVFQELDDDDRTVDNLAELLGELASVLSPMGSDNKYSRKRIYVLTAPGKSYEDPNGKDEVCPFCYRSYAEEAQS